MIRDKAHILLKQGYLPLRPITAPLSRHNSPNRPWWCWEDLAILCNTTHGAWIPCIQRALKPPPALYNPTLAVLRSDFYCRGSKSLAVQSHLGTPAATVGVEPGQLGSQTTVLLSLKILDDAAGRFLIIIRIIWNM